MSSRRGGMRMIGSPSSRWTRKGCVVMRDVCLRAALVVLYLCFVTPVAVVLRMLGRELLCAKIDRATRSYWRGIDINSSTKDVYVRPD